MKVRRAGIEDSESVYSLISSATRRGKILKRPLIEIRRIIGHFLVAEEKGRIIACCALEIYNKKLAEIRSLVVDKSWEKKGVASRLVNRGVREARRKKVYEVLVITDKENLFKRLGFSEQLQGQKALFLRP